MKKSLILISLMLAFNTFAQESITNENEMDMPESTRSDRSLIFSFFGVINEAQNRVKDDFNSGFGAFVEFRGSDQLGLETGAFYMNNQYVYSEGSIINVADVNRLHVPIMLKAWPVKFFNIGVGPYASFRVSDEEKISNIDTYKAIEDGSKTVEYGADFAGNFILSLNDSSGLFAGARYSLPFDQQSRDRLDRAVTYSAGLSIEL